MKNKKAIDKNVKFGSIIYDSLNSYLKELNIDDILELSGHPTWLFLKIKGNSSDQKIIRSFIFQEMIKNKILFLGSFNINYSFNINNIYKIIKVLKIYFKIKLIKQV